jgi:hypothetical protein
VLAPAGFLSLGLTYWPFSVVPDPNLPLAWADRAQLLLGVERLLRQLMGHHASTLHLLWAALGAGKTHTLLYLRQLALTNTGGAVFPVYTALPKACRTFVDIYRATVKGIGLDRLKNIYDFARKGDQDEVVRRTLSEAGPGLITAFEALRVGSEPIVDAGQRWILADPSLTQKDLRAASLSAKIRTTDDAISVLSAITRLIGVCARSRVLLMIDEFQRAGMLRRSCLDEINAGLHTYFNACPSGLTIVLSFTFGTAANIRHHLNEELQSRADPIVISIPSLDKENALIFLTDLVNGARSPAMELKVDSDVLQLIVEHTHSLGPITPRKLMQAAGSVLSIAAIDISDGKVERVDTAYAQKVLETLTASGLEGQQEE